LLIILIIVEKETFINNEYNKKVVVCLSNSYEEELADAEEVEINERGEIVPMGTKGRKGVKPPPHTFY